MDKLVIIRWVDAHTTSLDEIAPEDIDREIHSPIPTTSWGLLLKSDAVGVSMATDRQEGLDGGIHYRCANFVPRGMILEEITVDVPTLGAPLKRKRKAKVAGPRLESRGGRKVAQPQNNILDIEPPVCPATTPKS